MIQITCKDGSIHIYPNRTIIEIIFNDIKINLPTGSVHFYRGNEIKSIMEEGTIIWPKR